ncbi:MAG: CotH kinase family protein [Bacteroidia bacterium]
MKQLLILMLLGVCLQLSAQDFYDLSTIQTIEITFAQSNWDQLLDAEKNSTEDYIMAQSVSINGTVFDSVGVKYKGNSTYNANQTKNPFHIELDTYKDQDYQSYKDIKLSNVAKDPSFLREVLSYQILRQYMDAPLSNYANVYVNGNLLGLYSNSEAITKTFVKDRFYSNNNTFIKCNPPAGAGPQSNDFPNLVYLGQDSSNYYDAYEIKSDAGWAELIDLCDTLNNNIADIETILDVDRALWMLAFNNVFVNLDSYIGGFAQNYYLYRDDNRRFIPIVWDLNESFGQFANTGSGSLNNTTAKQQMSHLLHQNDASFPLVSKLLSNAMYKRMYLAHLKTMLLENFDDGSYYATGLSLQNTIDASVQADNNKFFTYANFTANLTNDVSTGGGGPGGGGSTPGITNLMDGRSSYLLGLSDFTQLEPSIANITQSNPSPIITETISIAADIAIANTAYIGYRSDVEAPFTRALMYDDGAHGDGAANDGTYGADITLESTYLQYYIYAENNSIGMFSPRRAEHEFHTLTATTTNPSVGDLVINEFLASNDITVADQDGEYDDWIELYNNGTSTIDLSSYYLSDDASDLMKWEFPAGSEIEANSYLIIWADNDEDQDGLHAGFKLSASAESILLIDDTGTILDEVSYVDQSADISYGRIPNGIGNFSLMPPTFGAENSLSTALDSFQDVTFTLYPNPAEGIFHIQFEDEISSAMQVYSLSGQMVHSQTISPDQYKISVEVANWPDGIYYVRFQFDDLVVSKKMVVLN